MSDTPTTTQPDDDADSSEPGFTTPDADRPPTDEEETMAERAAEDVDLDEVGKHYESAMETGANLHGEGEIEPQVD